MSTAAATCTWDVFSTLDGYGSFGRDADGRTSPTHRCGDRPASLNWSLLAAGLVDLELLDARTFDRRSQLLVYRPPAH